ncbi:MAG: ATP-dependent helicase HrpB [Kiritimatiellae bacterium]|nr:ATP-dependent helicase HrpB [Kiritimatiellia bacterium]
MFPVDKILPEIAASLARNRSVVLQAPPGSGKTTRVAPYLTGESWLANRKILLLEPRRLAARAAAAYMARQRGEAIGQHIGYHISLDRKVGRGTKIELLTEGILTRRILSDPELLETGLVIFDEFHERNLFADMAFALILDIRRALRPDLRMLVMSATIQTGKIAEHMGDADIHAAETRMYPIETRMLERLRTGGRSLPSQAASAVLKALEEEDGSILVFLPGEGEIMRTLETLCAASLPESVSLYPLYGALPREAQDAAIAPAPAGKRKVVLATSIAETSITIEGIRVVIDTGWMRVPRFSPRNGMSRLETLRITRDRADQRRGRAGRVCPGICYRLWGPVTDCQLLPETLPEILEADLCATVLQSADWGTPAIDCLPWLTPPPAAAWCQAVSLLQELGALSKSVSAAETPTLTAKGKAMSLLPVHPRLSHMIIEAARHGCAQQACLLAAIISENAADRTMRHQTDVRLLGDHFSQKPRGRHGARILELAKNWGSAYPAADTTALSEGKLLAWAFPDRLARKRGAEGGYIMRSGRGAFLDSSDPLNQHEWIVAAELQDDQAAARIRLAAPISKEEIDEAFKQHYSIVTKTFWNTRTDSVQAATRTCLGAITVKEVILPEPDTGDILESLCEGIRLKGLNALPWTKKSRSLQARVTFLHKTFEEQPWPDLSDSELLGNLTEFLRPFCDGVKRWSQIMGLDMHNIIACHIAECGCSRQLLDKLAPSHITVPSGSKVTVHYDDCEPYLEVKIQEVFGMQNTPVIADGRVPLIMRLLSPANRPVQVTRDLVSFWRQGYALVRKDLRGRYPKHYWPENPYDAVPTTKVRPN